MGLSAEIGATELAGVATPVVQVQVRVLPDGRMSARDSAAYLGHSMARMATWRMEGNGPAWVRVGGKIFYRREELDRFIKEGK
jgi:hypothetical protein